VPKRHMNNLQHWQPSQGQEGALDCKNDLALSGGCRGKTQSAAMRLHRIQQSANSIEYYRSSACCTAALIGDPLVSSSDSATRVGSFFAISGLLCPWTWLPVLQDCSYAALAPFKSP